MPGKNIVKDFVPDGYYHIYNRGINKDPIFLDTRDYSVFLNYLATLLSPKDEEALQDKLEDPTLSAEEHKKARKLLRLNNFYEEITFISYCLMPNHFHLLLRQHSEKSIENFMRSLVTRYVMYINKRHKRVGPLFQSKYKAVLVTSELQLRYLTKYIHRNPLALPQYKGIKAHEVLCHHPCSYSAYVDKKFYDWIHPEAIMDPKSNESITSYRSFVEGSNLYEEMQIIREITIDL